MKKTYVIAGGVLALILVVLVIVIAVSDNSGNTGQKPGTEADRELTNEQNPSKNEKDETEIIEDDKSLRDTDKKDADKKDTNNADTDKSDTDRNNTDKNEHKGDGDQSGNENQTGNGEPDDSKPVELPFVPYNPTE